MFSRVCCDAVVADFLEARTGRIDLSLYSAEFLKSVVHYMYNEELPKNTDLLDLLKFADQYQMHHMRAACELKLKTAADNI